LPIERERRERERERKEERERDRENVIQYCMGELNKNSIYRQL
jgi:hypothetical protein